jgi:hypothetical protein
MIDVIKRFTLRLLPIARPLWRTVRQRASSVILELRLQRKWLADRSRLPLTAEHKKLYLKIHRSYWRKMHVLPDLVTNEGLGEKILWLELFDQDPRKVVCADKLAVRDVIRQQLGDGYLPELYQTARTFAELDLARLPDSFVLKANHDCGSVFIVRNKDELDAAAVGETIDRALKRPYGYELGEWHYLYIPPRVFAEALLQDQQTEVLDDYKFFCANGRVICCQYFYDRGPNTKVQIIDRDGNVTDHWISPKTRVRGNKFRKPPVWDEMISVTERLASGFKMVRVDLYLVNGRVYVGEFTFTPMSGHYHGDGNERLGQLFDIDRSTVKPLLESFPALREQRRRNFPDFAI